MKYIKYIGTFLFVILIFVTIFYFWAKRSLHNESDYSVLLSSTAHSKPIIHDTFSIMTYNIGYLSGMTNNIAVERPLSLLESNLEKAVNLLKENNPDIIGFQEIDFNSKRTYQVDQFSELSQLAGYKYGAKAVNWDKQYVPFPYWPIKHHFGEMYSGQALLSHSPIISSERLVLPIPQSNPFYYNDFYLDRLAQAVWIKTEQDSLLIINVHFEAWDGPTRELQADIVIELYNKYEKNYPIILMGDFNCNPPFDKEAFQEKTVSVILSHPSISMVIDKAEYLDNPKLFYTFNSIKPYEKIDYIFYNNRFLTCFDSKVMYEADEISDHIPIMASFCLANLKNISH